MIWKSLGLLFDFQPKYKWMNTHASLPTVLKISNDSFRIFFSTRDYLNRSHTTFVDLNMANWLPGEKLIHNQSNPSFSPGKIGHFDDCGVSVTTFIKMDSKLFAYYLGWTIKKTTPLSNEIGIAYVDKNYNFHRIQNLPVYGRTEIEPLTFGYPTIFKYKQKTSLYYDAIDEWDENNLKMYKSYLRQAYLSINSGWTLENKQLIKLNLLERAITRPSLFTYKNKLIMVYSLDINGNYTLAASELNKENKWISIKKFEFIASGKEWDNNSICYPCTFKFNKEVYMLYNGNQYGKTGFGIAKLISF